MNTVTPAPDRSGQPSANRDAIAIKAVVRTLDAWKVPMPDAAKLFAVSERTWSRMRAAQWDGNLTQDQLTRASGLVGVYKALHLYFGEALADMWVTMPNRGPLFNGMPPLSFMVDGGIPAILETREYIDSIRGGL